MTWTQLPAETVQAIREGLADSAAGRVKPARKALQALGKKYGMTGGDGRSPD